MSGNNLSDNIRRKANSGSLNSLHYEVLREIGNIGLGNAVTSLSKLLGKPVKMTVPKVKLLDFNDTSSIIGSPEEQVFGVLVGISGDISGIMMFIVKMDTARVLIDSLIGRTDHDGNNFTDMELSALEEIGNILSSSYLGALSGLIGKKVIPSAPKLAWDMAAAILSVPAIEFSKISDKVLFIDTVFVTDGVNSSGYFLLVPDMPSFNTILSSLGVVQNEF